MKREMQVVDRGSVGQAGRYGMVSGSYFDRVEHEM
jgi:hypothetical protein